MFLAKKFASPILLRLAYITLCVVTGATGLWGQAATGTVTGVITDEQGAVVPAADLKLVETNTGSSRSVETNESGRFTIVNVPPGVYDITVTKAGFQTSKAVAQKVDIGAVLTLNLALKVGQAATTVEVSATAGAELQTLNATIGSTITNESLQLLPNLGRDASSLSVLQVGVTLTGNVAGAATDQNKFQLDGGNNSDDMAGSNAVYTAANGYSGTAASGGTPTGVIPTPIESIEEFKIGTTGQTADFGGAAGSQVQMVTKRGTNQFHGALYEFYFGSNVGAANLWRNNHTLVTDPKNPTGPKIATPLPATHRNRYGIAVGGPMTPKFWGGKTYFFFNYEASRFPNVISFDHGVPTALMRAGVVTLTDTKGGRSAYNLNPFPVTVAGTTYQPATCGGAPCDPRGIGLNPVVRKLWDTLPLPNDPTFTAGSATAGLVDGINAQGYLGNLRLPQTSNFFVGRIDHDFGEKWKFMSSYRYYTFNQLASTQVDIGGILPGATQGQYQSFAPRPVKPSYWAAGLTTTITPTLTNDFHFSYLRNFWQWSTQAGPPQFAGLGGAVEVGGESQTGSLIPYNVDSQDVRQRYWDGHDYFLSDSMSKIKGNHLFQWGGSYQRNLDLHGRDDNGVGINTSAVYKVDGTGIPSGYALPDGAAANQLTNFPIMYNEIMGIVTQTQIMYSRSGKNLQLNPIGTPGFDRSSIPTFDTYFTDTWHIRPSVTLSYGVSYNLTMPPLEENGKQVLMVDAAGNPVDIKGYLQNRQNAALQGGVYNPQIGFETINNVQGGQIKYPFNPFYGGFSPHASIAWNPNFGGGMMDKVFGQGKTVIRGGYGRIYGRLNGVNLLLVPLLGPGLLQAVSCQGLTNAGPTCLGAGGANLSNAYRIGVDGNSPLIPSATATLPQPFFPGTNQNGVTSAPAADGSQLDPKLRPNHSDEFNFTIQRAITPKILFEAGYIGRKISNEFQEINIDPIPWMTTLNGQSFAQAWAGMYNQVCAGAGPTCTIPANAAVTPQPFFEAAMGGATSAYCAGSPSCTAAVVKNEGARISSTNAYQAWYNLSQKPGWVLGRTLLAQPGAGQSLSGAFDFINSYGHGSYNAAFFSLTAKDWRGLTVRSNFTWGRALGTGSVTQSSSSITVPNPYDFNNFGTYGVQPFDVKFTYSMLMLYQPPFFRSQKGLVGRALGGWSIAPLFTARTGLPQRVSVGGNYGAFGEIYSGQSANYENAAGKSPYTGNGQAAYNVPIPSGGVASSGTTGVNLFADPLTVYNEFRRPVLGQDFNSGGTGVIRGFPFWNLDATISKDFKIRESIGATLNFQFVNVLNHFVPADPTTNIDTPSSWGVVTTQFTTPNGAQARSMEFGLRIRF